MWHHKTKVGTFWIVESDEDHEYYLGFDGDSLGHYKRLDEAIKHINEHETGEMKWDMSNLSDLPTDLAAWQEGEPENWDDF